VELELAEMFSDQFQCELVCPNPCLS